jgi:LemA protein
MVFESICFIAIALAGFVVLIVLALTVIGIYNKLILLRNNVDKEWSNIDVLLKRRYDLIPNLMETVKGYMKHERQTLTEVTTYRAMMATGTPQERMDANNMLTQTLKSLFMVAENYPNLKANENFMQLQQELANTENQISTIRTTYNNTVTPYLNAKQVFPDSIIAGMFAAIFPDKPFFKVEDVAREAPKISFSEDSEEEKPVVPKTRAK